MFVIITLGLLPGVIIFFVKQSQSILSRYWRWKLTLELEKCIKDAFDVSHGRIYEIKRLYCRKAENDGKVEDFSSRTD